MRRFEKLYAKPAHAWEIEVRGDEVHTRETLAGATTDDVERCASAEAASRTADERIAARRQQGFVEIKRVAAFLDEEPVSRKRRFEWVDGYAERVCELVQADRVVTRRDGVVRAGRDDLAGPHQERFVQIAQASARFDAIVRELVEARAAAVDLRASIPTATVELAPELAAACRAAGDDDAAPWAVCADWLAERGDPRGTAAGLAQGGRLDDAKAVLVARFPELATVRVELRHGFPSRLAVRARDVEALAAKLGAVLGCAAAELVEELELTVEAGTVNAVDWACVLDELVEQPQAAHLRGLALALFGRREEPEAADDAEARGALRSLGFAWRSLPSLRELRVDMAAGGNFAGLAIPSLRRLVRESGALPADELAAIVAARWPALEELELWLGAGNGVGLDDLAPLLDGDGVPRLGSLGLVNSELADELVEALARSRLLPRLYALDLSHGTLGATGAAALVRHARRFRHLASIDLYDNVLDDEAAERIRGALDNVILGSQRSDREPYVSTAE